MIYLFIYRNSSEEVLLDVHFRQSTCILYRTDVMFGWLDLLGKRRNLRRHIEKLLSQKCIVIILLTSMYLSILFYRTNWILICSSNDNNGQHLCVYFCSSVIRRMHRPVSRRFAAELRRAYLFFNVETVLPLAKLEKQKTHSKNVVRGKKYKFEILAKN